MSESERIRPKTRNKKLSKRNSCQSYCSELSEDADDVDEQIKTMTVKIRELQALQRQNNPKNKYNDRNKPKKDSDDISNSKSKRRLHHPKLDTVYVGVAHSPYLTDPAVEYTKDTIRISNALRQLNQSGRELKYISDLPFDLKKSKVKFVEALTFSPKFEVSSYGECQCNRSISKCMP